MGGKHTKRNNRPGGNGQDGLIGRTFPELAKRVKGLLDETKMTWGELARRAGLSRPTVHRLVRGEANPSMQGFLRLSGALNTSLAYLLGPQRGVDLDLRGGRVLSQSLLTDPPRGDARSRAIYQALCRGIRMKDIYAEIERTHFRMTAETPDEAITRAILDVFHHQQAWIDAASLPRSRTLERRLSDKFGLPLRPELEEDDVPVRVINLPGKLPPMMQIHVVAMMTAALVRQLMRNYRVLGFSDGFAVSTAQRFLRRGDLSPRTDLVPLTLTPRFAEFELSGTALIGAMARAHLGYQIRSTVELRALKERISLVEVSVTSCGSVNDGSPHGRLARLLREAGYDRDYETYLKMLREHDIVGDLVYNFLTSDGQWVRNVTGCASDIEEINLEKLKPPAKGDPCIYSVSPDKLASIAERGVSLLMVHSVDRAPLARAALQRSPRPVNVIVTTAAAAKKILKP